MVELTVEKVSQLVASELESIDDEQRRSKLKSLLIEPASTLRRSYYDEDETKLYPCWKVAQSPDRPEIIIVYSKFGIADHWGVIGAKDSDNLGHDFDWFSYLDDAFIRAFWDGPLPDDYEIR